MSKPNRVIRDDDSEPIEATIAEAAPPPQPATRHAPPPRERKPRQSRSTGGNGAYPGRKQVTAYVDRQLYLWIRTISVETDRSMIALMEQALTEFVQRHAALRKFSDGIRQSPHTVDIQ